MRWWRRVQIVLASADGEPNSAIAKRMGLTNATVGEWRNRYLENGIEGLHDDLRAGGPRSFEDERVADVINRALQTRPASGTHWKRLCSRSSICPARFPANAGSFEALEGADAVRLQLVACQVRCTVRS